MPRVRILNPRAAAPGLEPVALSQLILHEARSLTSPEQCARLDELTGQLRSVDPAGIVGDAARIAFWANLYNALLLHCLCMKPVRGSMLMHLRLFSSVAYEVGGHRCSLNLIEHGVLRRNRRPPFHLRRPLRGSDPFLATTPSRLDPRIHFVLNCGARSCPPIDVYDPAALESQLETATRSYLQMETAIEPDACRVTLPRLMHLYRADFGPQTDQLEFAARYLPEVQTCLSEGGPRVTIRYGRFDWTAAPGPSPP